MSEQNNVDELPSEPGAQPEDLMEFEGPAPDDLPPDSELPENDQELGDSEPQETEEEVDDGQA